MSIVLIGAGGVGAGVAATLPNLKIIDRDPLTLKKFEHLRQSCILHQIDHQNYRDKLKEYTNESDIVIDLADNLGTLDMIKWCAENGRHYICSAMCCWPGEEHLLLNPQEFMENLAREIGELECAQTILLIQGANPGMVNHFFNYSLDLLANDLGISLSEIYPRVRTVLSLETDSQQTKHDFIREEKTFYSTWNVKQFHFESSCQPSYFVENGEVDFLPRDKIKFRVSLNDGQFVFSGAQIAHEEVISISHYLAEHHDNHQVTTRFIYKPAPIMEESLQRFPEYCEEGSLYSAHVLTDEIMQGTDFVGIFVQLDTGEGWFTGYDLDLLEARRYYEKSNATCWYVSAGILAALSWLQKHPQQGILAPEEMDGVEMVEIFRQYINKPLISERISSAVIEQV